MPNCKVCGNNRNLKFYDVKERQLNKGETFKYCLCSKCGTLQLDQAVPNMEDYYGDAYYSFTMKSIRMQIPRFIIQPILFLSSKGFPKNGKCFRYLNKIVKYHKLYKFFKKYLKKYKYNSVYPP